MSEKTEKRKSVRNLYDAETGLPIMINLYVIKFIYYHIKKADCFIEERKTGKKPKSYEIYGNYIPMSRQRFDRINKGVAFEVSANEANDLIERYGFDERYFRKDNPEYFEIKGLTLTDWKCFYNHRYSGGYELPPLCQGNEELIKIKADRIEEVLREVISDFWKSELKQDTPVFAICYYFATGTRYGEERAVDKFRKIMREVRYSDWNNVELDLLNADFKLLKKHLNYISSVITIRTVMNEENK